MVMITQVSSIFDGKDSGIQVLEREFFLNRFIYFNSQQVFHTRGDFSLKFERKQVSSGHSSKYQQCCTLDDLNFSFDLQFLSDSTRLSQRMFSEWSQLK